MDIVLRAFSESLDLREHAARLPPDLVIKSWARGELDLLRRPVDHSGFTLSLADDDDGPAAMAEAALCLEQVSAELTKLASEGVELVMHIGLFVYEGHTPASAYLPQPLLAQLSGLGVSLKISAYPCADEEDEENEA
jgi:hypothetical protein